MRTRRVPASQEQSVVASNPREGWRCMRNERNHAWRMGAIRPQLAIRRHPNRTEATERNIIYGGRISRTDVHRLEDRNRISNLGRSSRTVHRMLGIDREATDETTPRSRSGRPHSRTQSIDGGRVSARATFLDAHPHPSEAISRGSRVTRTNRGLKSRRGHGAHLVGVTGGPYFRYFRRKHQ